MSAIRAAIGELVGLFVDDGSLALPTVIWVALVGVGLRLLDVPPPGLAGLVLFGGIAAVLTTSVRRAATR